MDRNILGGNFLGVFQGVIFLETMFEFYWRQKQQQEEVHYVQNTELHEDNHIEEENLDLCNEDSEGKSEPFLQSLANDDVKKSNK